jgi:uncharacterized lipoprotein YbaY
MSITRSLVAIAALTMSAAAFGQELRDRDGLGTAGAFGGQSTDSRWSNPGGGWRPPSYQLGVQIRNTDRGALLTNVLPGSAAQRAGLERNDVILTVGGYQVGYVGRQLYDLGDEINARTSTDGRVLLLIRNGRNGELRNITVDMATSRGVVNGTIRWANDVSLSRNAMLTVRIVDVSNPAWRDVIVAEQVYRGVTRGSSQYQVGYSPANIQANRRYAISAHIRDGDYVPFETAQPRNITLNGGEQRLDFTLDRARDQSGNRPGGFPTAQIVDLYRVVLGRAPNAREIAMWQAEFDRGATIEDVRRQLLGGSEYYDRNRNDDNRFLSDVYSNTQGRAPDAEEMERMRDQLKSSGGMRTDLVRDLMKRMEAAKAPPR